MNLIWQRSKDYWYEFNMCNSLEMESYLKLSLQSWKRRMVDTEIDAWSSLFLNIKTNLILALYPEKCIKFNQSESRIWTR